MTGGVLEVLVRPCPYVAATINQPRSNKTYIRCRLLSLDLPYFEKQPFIAHQSNTRNILHCL
jgi:hypothetical protein